MSKTESDYSFYFSGQHPLKVAVGEVEPKEAADFIHGCGEIYKLMVNIDPDVIFFPERGAMPIKWALDVIADSEGRKLQTVSLLLGEHFVVETEKVGHCPNKRLVIEHGVRRASKLYGPLKKPMLIDEAQSGGTLIRPVRFLCSELSKLGIMEPLYIIVAQDTKGPYLTLKREPGADCLDEIRKPYTKVDILEMPLVCTDQEVFLNHILYFEKYGDRAPLRQKLIRNLQASQFINTLALAMVKPEEFDALVFSVNKSPLIRSALSSNSDLSGVSEEQISNWFTEYKNYLQA